MVYDKVNGILFVFCWHMKKHFLFFLLLLGANGTYAQSGPKATLYGIIIPTPTAKQVIDSIENADPASIIRVNNAVVMGFTFVYSQISGKAIKEQVNGSTISPKLKEMLKKAEGGDKIVISDIKISVAGSQSITRNGMFYMLK
jgi:hypothetical protein